MSPSELLRVLVVQENEALMQTFISNNIQNDALNTANSLSCKKLDAVRESFNDFMTKSDSDQIWLR